MAPTIAVEARWLKACRSRPYRYAHATIGLIERFVAGRSFALLRAELQMLETALGHAGSALLGATRWLGRVVSQMEQLGHGSRWNEWTPRDQYALAVWALLQSPIGRDSPIGREESAEPVAYYFHQANGNLMDMLAAARRTAPPPHGVCAAIVKDLALSCVVPVLQLLHSAYAAVAATPSCQRSLELMHGVWRWIVCPVLDAGAHVASGLWRSLLCPAVDAGAYAASSVWRWIVCPVLDAGAHAASGSWRSLLCPAMDAGAYAASSVWRWIVCPVLDAGAHVASGLWRSLLCPAVDAGAYAASSVWRWIVCPVLDAGAHAASGLWRSLLCPAVDAGVNMWRHAVDCFDNHVRQPWLEKESAKRIEHMALQRLDPQRYMSRRRSLV
eukprot:SAG11_NODE_2736_length_3028_cov_3.460567_2_plen_385_part_00